MEFEKHKPRSLFRTEIETDPKDHSKIFNEESSNNAYFKIDAPQIEICASPLALERTPQVILYSGDRTLPEHSNVVHPDAETLKNRSIDIKIRDFLLKSPRLTVNRRCTVCNNSQNGQKMKFVSCEEEKLITMIGCIFLGTYTIDQAIAFMMKKGYRLACNAHFLKSIQQIFKLLDIHSLIEIPTYSLDLLQNVMVVVTAIWPQLSAVQFRYMLYTSSMRNLRIPMMNMSNSGSSIEAPMSSSICQQTHAPEVLPKQPPSKYQCSICSQQKLRRHLRAVSSEDQKLVLMVGRVLRGESTIEQAQLFLSIDISTYICNAHFASIDEIFKTLEIGSLDEIISYSSHQMNELMITVNAICPEMMTWKFCHILANSLVEISKSETLPRSLNAFLA